MRLLIRQYAPKGKVIPIISGSESDTSQFLTNVANDVALTIWYEWRDDPSYPRDVQPQVAKD